MKNGYVVIIFTFSKELLKSFFFFFWGKKVRVWTAALNIAILNMLLFFPEKKKTNIYML